MRRVMRVAAALCAAVVAGCTGSEPSPDPTPAEEVVRSAVAAPGVAPLEASAAWTDDLSTLARLWDDYGFDAPQPSLDGEAILLVSTPGSSSCPAVVTDVVVGVRSVGLSVVSPQPPPKDGRLTMCTADLAPRTHVLRLRRDAIAPPFVVDLGDTRISLEQAGVVAIDDEVSASEGVSPR